MELIGELERGFATAIYPNRLMIAGVGVVLLAILAVLGRRRGWGRVARRHPMWTGAVIVLALTVTGPMAWYLGSPLFVSSSIDEPPPVAVVEPTLPATPGATASTPTHTQGVATSVPGAASAPPSTTPPARAPDRSGTFKGADEFHFGRGSALLVETAPGVFVVRLQDFAVRNGPDLYVYLSSASDGYSADAVELGRLKADRGNQNYRLPADVSVDSAKSVVIWCKQFGVLFATAPLS